MSLLAHATYGSTDFTIEKKSMSAKAQSEIVEAKRIQHQLRCTWTEALRIACKGDKK
jgi:hypothetical protein